MREYPGLRLHRDGSVMETRGEHRSRWKTSKDEGLAAWDGRRLIEWRAQGEPGAKVLGLLWAGNASPTVLSVVVSPGVTLP